MSFDQNSYINEYKRQNYDRIIIEVPKGTRSTWKELASREGLSLKEYIVRAVEEYEIQNLKGES